MKLTVQQQSEVDAILDQAIRENGTDHIKAAYAAEDELVSLEAGGHAWASSVLDAARHHGMVQRIKIRAKRAAVHVPFAGEKKALPARYSRRLADGSRQLEFWIDLPLDALSDLIAALRAQSAVLDTRAAQMAEGLRLAQEHGVPTAREGFAAIGIDITTAAAA